MGSVWPTRMEKRKETAWSPLRIPPAVQSMNKVDATSITPNVSPVHDDLCQAVNLASKKLMDLKHAAQRRFEQFRPESMSSYVLSRLEVLVRQANAVNSLTANFQLLTDRDCMRVIRSCARLSAWLMELLSECEAIVQKQGPAHTAPVIRLI